MNSQKFGLYQELEIHPVGNLGSLSWMAHGPYLLKGVDEPTEIYEVGVEGYAPLTPPLDNEKARCAVPIGDEVTLGWRPSLDAQVPGRPHWVLHEKIGAGGFGEVWLASHDKTKEQRVFKFCFQAEQLRALKREVVLFRLLKETLGDRDDITRILDWQFDEAPFYLESEYSEGGSLTDWFEKQGGVKKVPLKTRLSIIADAADALAAAHSVGILHKDIKPANILVKTDIRGNLKVQLTDFGIGQITERRYLDEHGITATGMTEMIAPSSTTGSGYHSGAGTRLYMSPEHLEGKPFSTLSDIYSLGVILYQVLSGELSIAFSPGWRDHIEDDLLCEDTLPGYIESAPPFHLMRRKDRRKE